MERIIYVVSWRKHRASSVMQLEFPLRKNLKE